MGNWVWRDILGDEAGKVGWDESVVGALKALLENLDFLVGWGEVGVI